MNGSAAKATRREIRRAVGQSGLDAVNQTAVTVFQEVLPRLSFIDSYLGEIHTRLNALESACQGLRTDLDRFANRTFRERLRWLVFGR